MTLEKGWPTCVESDGRSYWSVATQREGWCQALPVTRQAFVSASWGLAVQLKGKVGAAWGPHSSSWHSWCEQDIRLQQCRFVNLLSPHTSVHLGPRRDHTLKQWQAHILTVDPVQAGSPLLESIGLKLLLGVREVLQASPACGEERPYAQSCSAYISLLHWASELTFSGAGQCYMV